MPRYLFHRLLLIIPTLLLISFVAFLIIQAAPGDCVSYYIATEKERGIILEVGVVNSLKARQGIGRPLHIQYGRWIANLCRGYLSFDNSTCIIIAKRLPYSLLICLTAMLFIYSVGLPVALVSAARQYGAVDLIFSSIFAAGLAIPQFLLALGILWIYYDNTGKSLGGLFSPELETAEWSFSKLGDLINHIWLPSLIVGSSGLVITVRTMRATILDELQKPYVIAARARGVPFPRLVYKYPFRMALCPVLSTVGWTLPQLVAGEFVVSIVLGLPTLGPILLRSVQAQDVYLAGNILVILAFFVLTGNLVSDILVGLIDPRVREDSL